jgi:hypothetical protein
MWTDGARRATGGEVITKGKFAGSFRARGKMAATPVNIPAIEGVITVAAIRNHLAAKVSAAVKTSQSKGARR